MYTTILSLCQSCCTKAVTFISEGQIAHAAVSWKKNEYNYNKEKLGAKLN